MEAWAIFAQRAEREIRDARLALPLLLQDLAVEVREARMVLRELPLTMPGLLGLFLMHLLLQSTFFFRALSYFLLQSALKALPYAGSGVAVLYTWRLGRSEVLQQEWRDFLWQWCAAERVACPICAETVPATGWHLATLSCCRRPVCWACVRRHAEAVIDDARPEMLCPLSPCQRVLPDTVVLAAIRREQWSWSRLDVLGTRAGRKKRSYERWVLSCGLAATCAARAEDVVHCSGGECGHMWVMPRALRRRKLREEPTSGWNPKSWSLTRHMGLYTPSTKDGRDQRRIHCPKCNLDYCILCSRRWSRGSKEDHEGKTCLEYSASCEGGDLADHQWGGAKACPGCGVRIIRTMGCNHMTCTQCGDEWCWVCSSKWAPRHYSCSQLRYNDVCSMM